MKYTYHILTPFSRFQNLVAFTKMLKPFGVHWHPGFDYDLLFRLMENGWIHPFYCPHREPGWEGHPSHWIMDWFFNHHAIVPDHRYMQLNDDDALEPDFFEKVDKHVGDTIIVTALRGHHQPPTGPQYGTGTLEAKPENVKPAHISGEQLIWTGRALGSDRIGPLGCADGQFIVNVTKRVPPEFAPEAHIWFNYYEPGRWDK